MGRLFSSIGHLFHSIETDVIVICHTLILSLHALFTGTEIQAGIDALATAGINYANQQFEKADTHAFVQQKLMLLPGMNYERANLLTAHLMSLAEKKVDGLLESIHHHFTQDNQATK